MRINFKKIALIGVLILAAGVNTLFAQKGVDTLKMLDGAIKFGKVLDLNSQNIQFVHDGETLVYTVDRFKVHKIVFASGRTELINNTAGTPALGVMVEPNTVAVLPFVYHDKNISSSDAGTFREKVQEETYQFLSGKSGLYKYQDPNTTNVILRRQGIDEQSIKNYTYADLCKALGVHYVVVGGVYRHSNDRIEAGSYGDIWGDCDWGLSSVSGTSISYQKDYQNEVVLNIYSVNNERIYTKRRTAVLMNEASYRYALQYMLKRSPVYNKR